MADAPVLFVHVSRLIIGGGREAELSGGEGMSRAERAVLTPTPRPPTSAWPLLHPQNGKTPLDFARENRKPALVALLSKPQWAVPPLQV